MVGRFWAVSLSRVHASERSAHARRARRLRTLAVGDGERTSAARSASASSTDRESESDRWRRAGCGMITSRLGDSAQCRLDCICRYPSSRCMSEALEMRKDFFGAGLVGKATGPGGATTERGPRCQSMGVLCSTDGACRKRGGRSVPPPLRLNSAETPRRSWSVVNCKVLPPPRNRSVSIELTIRLTVSSTPRRLPIRRE